MSASLLIPGGLPGLATSVVLPTGVNTSSWSALSWCAADPTAVMDYTIDGTSFLAQRGATLVSVLPEWDQSLTVTGVTATAAGVVTLLATGGLVGQSPAVGMRWTLSDGEVIVFSVVRPTVLLLPQNLTLGSVVTPPLGNSPLPGLIAAIL